MHRLGVLAALVAVTSWGSMFSIMAHLLAVWDPYWLTCIRYVGATVILAVMLLVAEGPKAFVVGPRRWLLFGIGAAGIAGFNLFVLNGVARGSAEHAALFVALAARTRLYRRFSRDHQGRPRDSRRRFVDG